MTSDPRRIVISTVFECKYPYMHETEILFRTLRRFGGRLSTARAVAWCVGPCEPFVRDTLEALDVEVRETTALLDDYPHANKLRMFTPYDDADIVLGLDTDTAIGGDFTSHLDYRCIRAKPADGFNMDVDVWRKWAELNGVSLPHDHYLASMTGGLLPAYFNTGVVMVPMHLVAALAERWETMIHKVRDSFDELELIRDLEFFTDQHAFAFAVHSLGAPYRTLPESMNYPTHGPIHRVFQPESITPLIIHHHHRFAESGELYAGYHKAGNAVIDEINSEFSDASETDAPQPTHIPIPDEPPSFDNREFWNERYASNPALGSGIGSRNQLLAYKRDRLQEVIDETAPTSILDVGCGDMAIVAELDTSAAYTGVDVSDVIVERNARRFPDRTFLHRNASAAVAEPLPAADMVLCLDVLIHQHDAAEYEQMVGQVLTAARQTAIFAGYETAPSGAFASDITAFHEPLSETIHRLDGGHVTQIGEYRGTALLRVDNDTSHASTATPSRHATERWQDLLARAPLSDGVPADLDTLLQIRAEHPRNIAPGKLVQLASEHPAPGWLAELYRCALQSITFFPDHDPRVWEYPVVAALATALLPDTGRVVDVGAGVSPLAPYLHRAGHVVHTVDPSANERVWPPDDTWNEWDFLNYGLVELATASWNTTLDAIPAGEYFDVVTSVSVIEHLRADMRRELLSEMHHRTRPSGHAILTVDVERDGDALWNRDRGREVDPPSLHGTVGELCDELEQAGWTLVDSDVIRGWGDAPVDIGLFIARRK